jgi:hypothetical protein
MCWKLCKFENKKMKEMRFEAIMRIVMRIVSPLTGLVSPTPWDHRVPSIRGVTESLSDKEKYGSHRLYPSLHVSLTCLSKLQFKKSKFLFVVENEMSINSPKLLRCFHTSSACWNFPFRSCLEQLQNPFSSDTVSDFRVLYYPQELLG